MKWDGVGASPSRNRAHMWGSFLVSSPIDHQPQHYLDACFHLVPLDYYGDSQERSPLEPRVVQDLHCRG